jgi:hypothetical protein
MLMWMRERGGGGEREIAYSHQPAVLLALLSENESA